MEIPIIDIEKTSINLKTIREKKKTKISELQNLFCMENPQSIYNWENPAKKNLPRIDNFVILAKFYNVRIDDLIVIKEEKSDYFQVSEASVNYAVPFETIVFLKENSSDSILKALQRYFNLDLSI